MVTILLFLTWLVYSIQRFQIFYFRSNPNVNVSSQMNYFDRSYEVDYKDIGFKLAFSVNDFATGVALDDPNFVRWTVSISTWLNQKRIDNVYLSFHKCTDDDYNSFYPPSAQSVEGIKYAKSTLDMYCIDPDQDIKVYGRDNFGQRRLEFNFLPCIPDPARNICMN